MDRCFDRVFRYRHLRPRIEVLEHHAEHPMAAARFMQVLDKQFGHESVERRFPESGLRGRNQYGSRLKSSITGPGASTSMLQTKCWAKAARKWFFALMHSSRTCCKSIPCRRHQAMSLGDWQVSVTTTRSNGSCTPRSTTVRPIWHDKPCSIGPSLMKSPLVRRSTTASKAIEPPYSGTTRPPSWTCKWAPTPRAWHCPTSAGS